MCAAFLPPKVPHFDGRATVRRILPDCGAFCRENAAHLPNLSAFAKNHGVFAKERQRAPQFLIPALPVQTTKVRHNFLSKSGTQIFTNCCILFYVYRTHTCMQYILLTCFSKLLKLKCLTQYIHHFQHSNRIRAGFFVNKNYYYY